MPLIPAFQRGRSRDLYELQANLDRVCVVTPCFKSKNKTKHQSAALSACRYLAHHVWKGQRDSQLRVNNRSEEAQGEGDPYGKAVHCLSFVVKIMSIVIFKYFSITQN